MNKDKLKFMMAMGIWFAVWGLIILLTSCDLSQEPQYLIKQRDVPKIRVVAGKEAAVETHTRSEYNWSKGAFYSIPYTQTMYYVVYQDGHTEKVSIGKYTTTRIGDTVIFKIPQDYKVKNPAYKPDEQ